MQRLTYAARAVWKVIVIKYGHIDVDVSLDDLNSLEFKDYTQCYQQTSNIEKYYNEHNSSVWQMFDDDCPKWVHELANLIPQDFNKYVVSVIMLNPGQTVPYHIDKHYKLKQRFGEGESFRYLIFLEDWKRGHYYEIHDQPFTKWRKGDWVKFGSDDWHLAGNMGELPFYSAQVTVLNDV